MNRDARKKQLKKQRMKHLIAQGAIYRTEVLLAKQAVHDSLQPDTLARSALHKLGLAALAAFRNRNAPGFASLAGLDLQTVLPLAMTGISLLARKKSLAKKLLRGAAVAGVVAGAVALLSRKKKAADGNAQ